MIRLLLVLALTAGALTGPSAPAATPVAFDCSGRNGIEAMENSYVDVLGAGACWGHLGHHTYDAGALYEVGMVEGRIFSVEAQLSPPIELVDEEAAAIVVEGSEDSRSWRTLHQIPYAMLLRGNTLLPTRQGIDFSFDAGRARARWLRIRQPLSAAQGLSGYLDSSRFTAELTPAAPSDDPVIQPIADARSCWDGIMEAIYPGHPCWFGGVNRYDSPSVFHTYFVDRADVVGVRGDVTFLPWRSDDYTQNGGSRREIRGVVQTSNDGVEWTDVATVAGTFGTPLSFDALLPEPGLTYMRLVAERHMGYTTHPALKHARAFIADSRVALVSE